MMNKIEETTLNISDMTCSGCAGNIEEALANLKGVEKATADHQKGTAKVSFQIDTVSTDDFKRAVEDAGYSFEGVK